MFSDVNLYKYWMMIMIIMITILITTTMANKIAAIIMIIRIARMMMRIISNRNNNNIMIMKMIMMGIQKMVKMINIIIVMSMTNPKARSHKKTRKFSKSTPSEGNKINLRSDVN